MASKIILKKSNVASKVPVVGDLDFGELALNYTDGKLWYKNNSNVITQLNALVGTVPVASGGTGLTSYTANGIVYASDANTLATNSGLTFDGTSLKVGRLITTAAATTNPVVIGRADSAVPTSVASISIGYNIGLIGSYSVSLGFEAARYGNGADNFVVGQAAGQGGATGNTYSNSIIIGNNAGYLLTTGSQNIYLGPLTGVMNTTGWYNTCVGAEAGRNATGDGNSFLGNLAGKSITTGANNTIVGRFNGNELGLNISTLSNYIVLSDGSGNPRLYSDASGNINIPSLTASKALFTDANKNLTSTGTVAIAQGGTGATTAAAARTNLEATTVGSNLFTLANPSAVTFPRFNADNTVSSLDAATLRTALGVGAGITQYLYDNRNQLRTASPANNDLALVEGLGLFQFFSGSTETDDDETCFATASGRWLLILVSWEFVEAWSLADKVAFEDLISEQAAQTDTRLKLLEAEYYLGTF